MTTRDILDLDFLLQSLAQAYALQAAPPAAGERFLARLPQAAPLSDEALDWLAAAGQTGQAPVSPRRRQ